MSLKFALLYNGWKRLLYLFPTPSNQSNVNRSLLYPGTWKNTQVFVGPEIKNLLKRDMDSNSVFVQPGCCVTIESISSVCVPSQHTVWNSIFIGLMLKHLQIFFDHKPNILFVSIFLQFFLHIVGISLICWTPCVTCSNPASFKMLTFYLTGSCRQNLV